MTEINDVQITRKLKCIPKKSRSKFFDKPWGIPPYPVFLLWTVLLEVDGWSVEGISTKG